ncbi:MAG: HK97 gp10 family phage protein [Conexivisphaerales archaeon]
MGTSIKGLDELIRKLRRLPEQIRSEIEREIRTAAEQVCAKARELCQDPLLAAQINYRVYRTNDTIGVEVTGPTATKDYLIQAFEELKPSLRDYVAQAIERAIKT